MPQMDSRGRGRGSFIPFLDFGLEVLGRDGWWEGGRSLLEVGQDAIGHCFAIVWVSCFEDTDCLLGCTVIPEFRRKGWNGKRCSVCLVEVLSIVILDE